MRSKIATFLLVLFFAPVCAQELPDMLGTWTYTVDGMEPHPQCGQSMQIGVMNVERKITPRAYRGKVRAEDSYEKCPGTQVSNSTVTIRVKEPTLITIDYDEEGWEMDRLRLNDGVMTGDNGKGVRTRWVRDDGNVNTEPSEEQLEELNSLLNQIQPEVINILKDEYFEQIWKALERTGDLEAEAAQQVTGVMIERMTGCMMEIVHEFSVNQMGVAGHSLNSQNTIVMFDPNTDEFIGTECVENAALNAGIRLR